jgi:hypothetical protein
MEEQPKPADAPVQAPSGDAPQNTIVSNVSKGLESARETITASVSKGSEAITAASAKYGLFVLVGIVIAAVLLLIGYLLYVYLSSRLTNKLTILIPESQIPRKGSEVSRLEGGAIPPASNGKRMTISFWIYIYDINKYAASEELRHVLHVGDENPIGASPSVYLDGTLNKLYIRFDKRTGTPTHLETRIREIRNTATLDAEAKDAGYIQGSTIKYHDALHIDLATRGIVIDYVPLQRWVHVSIVVNETVNKGYISAYLDSELVKSLSSSDKITLSDGKRLNISYQDLNLGKSGDVYIGGDLYNENIPKGFSGIVSKILVSNYDLNGQEVKKLYMQGPVDNLTSKLGLPAYGVRSPIYRVG